MSTNKNKGTMLGRALAIAATVHEKQTDMGGNAYFLHPLRLMMRLRTDDVELMIIAILHDCVEDSEGKVTIATLRAEGFSERILAALTLLSHDKTVPYEDYVRGISTNRDATRVKLEDLRDNSDITRLKGLRPKDFERIEKYHRAYVFLTGCQKAFEQAGY
jgi:(p)ppGpp synthase/HD superfamily hydrolase